MSSTQNDEWYEQLLAEWERARARYAGALIRTPNIFSVRSGGEYATEVSYNVSVSQGSVNVTVWGGGNGSISASAHGGAGGSSGFGVETYLAYHSDESTGTQMALAAGNVARPSCQHYLVVDVNTILGELVAKLCEQCGEQLVAEFSQPQQPLSNRAETILNQYGEPIARWTTQSGEWVIVRDLQASGTGDLMPIMEDTKQVVVSTIQMDDDVFIKHFEKRHADSLGGLRGFVTRTPGIILMYRMFHKRLHELRPFDYDHEHEHGA